MTAPIEYSQGPDLSSSDPEARSTNSPHSRKSAGSIRLAMFRKNSDSAAANASDGDVVVCLAGPLGVLAWSQENRFGRAEESLSLDRRHLSAEALHSLQMALSVTSVISMTLACFRLSGSIPPSCFREVTNVTGQSCRYRFRAMS